MPTTEELLTAKVVADEDIRNEYPEEFNKEEILDDNFGDNF